MKYTKVPSSTFQQLQLNAGMLLTSFTPSTATVSDSAIFAATSGGVTFNSGPQFEDYGEDIDNVPANTKQLKVLKYYDVHLTGTAKTVNADTLERLIAACDKTTASSVDKFTPRQGMMDSGTGGDFADIWWVGDYSDKNGATNGGYLAIRLIDAANTGGFQVKSNDDGKGDFAFDFQAHYDLDDPDTVPFEVYLKAGTAEPTSSGTGTGN